MSNMSYCRFENTLRDLKDCTTVIEDLLRGNLESPLSATELDACGSMIDEMAGCVQLVIEDLGFKDMDDLISNLARLRRELEILNSDGT